VLAATLVAAVLRFFRLGQDSLWIDEQFTLVAAGLHDHFAWRDLLGNVHGPLHTLAVAAAAAIGGTSEAVLRAPSAIAGVALVPVMAWLARRFTGPETVPAAAWLAAGSPFLVWYSRECRGYAFAMLFVALATGALLELHRRCDVRRVAGYVAAALVGALSNLSFALLLPLHLRLWLAPGPTRRARLVALAVVGGLAGLAILPWLPAIVGTWDWSRLTPGRDSAAGETPLRGTTTAHPAAIPFALHALLMGYSGGPSLAALRLDPVGALRAHLPEVVAAAVVFAALLGIGARGMARRGRLGATLLWLVAPALLVSYFAAHNFKVFHPRYLAAGAPCVLLVVAVAFADLGPRARRLFAVSVGLLWVLALGRIAFAPEYAREDYRGALARVREEIAPGERVLAVGAPEPVEWYGRGLQVARWWAGFSANPERMVATLSDSLAVAAGTWVVGSRTEDLDPEGRFARWLDTRVPAEDRWSKHGVSVWHWRRDGNPRPTGAPD
jgi:4-amino-4-deoxy-L-arabinose transferase-like glycosyltransferase